MTADNPLRQSSALFRVVSRGVDVIVCRCNWNIPNVEALPAHYHPASPRDTYEPGSLIERGPFKGQRTPRLVRDPDQIPHFLIDWKAIYRALSDGSSA